jgi:hypothetical protein
VNLCGGEIDYCPLMYKFYILAIGRVVVHVALRKYEVVSTGNCVCEKLILNI